MRLILVVVLCLGTIYALENYPANVIESYQESISDQVYNDHQRSLYRKATSVVKRILQFNPEKLGDFIFAIGEIMDMVGLAQSIQQTKVVYEAVKNTGDAIHNIVDQVEDLKDILEYQQEEYK